MTKEQAVRDFKREYADLYIKKVDYWKAQLAWSTYTDNLCKSGQITQKQWSSWSTPFPYGKRLRPSREQLERAVNQNG